MSCPAGLSSSPNATALVVADLAGSALTLRSPDEEAKALVPQLIVPEVALPPAMVRAVRLPACMHACTFHPSASCTCRL
jgi:hypothetical protein